MNILLTEGYVYAVTMEIFFPARFIAPISNEVIFLRSFGVAAEDNLLRIKRYIELYV